MVTRVIAPDGKLDTSAVQQALDVLNERFQNMESLFNQRFDTIDGIIDGEIIINPQSTATTRESGVVSKVSGLRTTASPVGTWTVVWNAVTDADILRYDIQVDDNLSFASPVTSRTAETKFTYQDAVQDETYYVRVRAVNRSAVAGSWSSTIDALSGKGFAADLEIGAASQIVENITTSFSPSSITTSGTTVTYGNLVMETIGRPVLLYTVATNDIAFGYTSGSNRLTLDILRDGSPIGPSIYLDFTSFGAVGVGRYSSGLPAPIDQPDAGTHTYQMRIRLDKGAANTLTVTPVNLYLTGLELKR